ncbi:MAG: transposase [Candidatus Dormibacteria bacterium]
MGTRGHLAHLVSDVVEHSLDLSRLYGAYGELRGAPPYDLRLLTKLLLYGYAPGVYGSRRIERAVQ